MDLPLFIAAAFIGGVIVGVAVEHYFYHRDSNTDDDPTGEKKQKIFDTLAKLKSDIESTVE